jgi:hypothetical protein
MAKEALRMGLSVSTDNESGEVLAVYFRVRQGKSAVTKEYGKGLAYADFDKKGNLLGVELLGPCEITVLDTIARKEPKPVKEFLRGAVPRRMALA